MSDECYPVAFMRVGTDATHEQKMAAYRKWKIDDQGMTWPDFFHTAEHTIGMDGAIVIRWCGMVLAIEVDGYTHS